MKRLVSLFVVLVFAAVLFTGTALLPELEIAKKINVMAIVNVFRLPERTILYLNKIFSNNTKEIPASSSQDSRKDFLFKLLLTTIMTAMIIPAVYKVSEPQLAPYTLTSILNVRCMRAPPAYSEHNPAAGSSGGRQRRRERKSTSFKSVSSDNDDSGCSSQSDPSTDLNKSSSPIGNGARNE